MTSSWSLTLDPDPTSVREARFFVADRLHRLDPPVPGSLIDTVVLLTSELASNAVLHGRSTFTVVVARRADSIRVEVRDLSRSLPRRRSYSLTATTGRGVALVQDQSDRTGVDLHADGKTVWFEIDVVRTGRPSPSAAAPDDGAAGRGERVS
jgi:anti-sigma regulatory factor (Ser/Thr protein kinase)